MGQTQISTSSRSALDTYVLWGLAVSVLAHLTIAAFVAKQPPQRFDTPVMVELVPEPRPMLESSKRQIVDTPDQAPPSEPLRDTRLEAERATAAEKEQIRRGDALSGPVVGPAGPPSAALEPRPRAEPKQPAPKAAAPKEPAKKERAREATAPLALNDLLLDPATMMRSFAAPAKKQRAADNPLLDTTAASAAGYAPFSRPTGSGARFLGSAGSNDYLPSLPDGDITLLNAKASQYAVFVRRVATQVFTELRTQGWEMLTGNDIRAATRFAVVEATLSPKGALLEVQLRSGSGSQRFDRLLHGAAQTGARDSNPPVGALAADGNIHFIFQAQSWVDIVPASRTGFPSERRWLLLGTGLQ